MAGVFDIDLDQPEENVSDDELEEVSVLFLPPLILCILVPALPASRLARLLK